MSNELGMTFTALTVGLAAKMYYDSKFAGVEYVKSTVDNKEYLVRTLPDKEKAADLLANIRLKLVKLCDYLELKHSDSEKVYRLIKRFNSDNITESSPNEKYTSEDLKACQSHYLNEIERLSYVFKNICK